ncbi:hypothetical protein B0H10DRAFT_1785794, partial [Mycena sp. CBHHK59/15]
LRLSSSQLWMILWIMQQCGAKDMPSFNAFRSMQTHIRKTTGVSSDPHKSDLGNLFYVNDVRDLIAKDFANPEVAPHIQKYPEDVEGGPISEIWQLKQGRWHEIPLDELTPSILIGYKHYYIHEIAELSAIVLSLLCGSFSRGRHMQTVTLWTKLCVSRSSFSLAA